MTDKRPTNARSTNATRWKRLRGRVFAEEDVCHLCLRPVDKSLPHLDPGAPELDHIVPLSMGGDMFARENNRLAHRICNQRKGNRTTTTPTEQPTAAQGTEPYSPQWNAVMFPVTRDWFAPVR